MLSMKYSQLGETISLPYPNATTDLPTTAGLIITRNDITSQIDESMYTPKIAQIIQDDYQQQYLPDESLLRLQRMEELTQHVLTLQKQFSYEYQKRQQQITITNSEVIPIGQVGLIAELKIANDQLRWKLKQRDCMIQSYQQQIQDLQSQVYLLKNNKNGLTTSENKLSLERPSTNTSSGTVDSFTSPSFQN
jgi:hypothetical protein